MTRVRARVLDGVRHFDPGAHLEGRTIRLGDGTTLPNERRALQWIVDTYQARTRTPRQAATLDPDLDAALAVVERDLGPVEVLEVWPDEPKAQHDR